MESMYMQALVGPCCDKGVETALHILHFSIYEPNWQVFLLPDPHLALIGDLKVSVSGLCRLGGLPITTVEPPRLRLGGDLVAPTPAQHQQLVTTLSPPTLIPLQPLLITMLSLRPIHPVCYPWK